MTADENRCDSFEHTEQWPSFLPKWGEQTAQNFFLHGRNGML